MEIVFVKLGASKSIRLKNSIAIGFQACGDTCITKVAGNRFNNIYKF